jgi:predicted DNA-binding mobile mystery protein A
MTMDKTALARKSLDKRLAPLHELPLAVTPRGWIRAIRESLSMTTRQMAERMGVARSWITTIEKAEVTGTTTLKSLRAAAEALDCTLVYAIVPTKSLDAIMRARATEKADAELAHILHTMALENQALTKADLEQERARLIDELLAGSGRRLWEDE